MGYEWVGVWVVGYNAGPAGVAAAVVPLYYYSIHIVRKK